MLKLSYDVLNVVDRVALMQNSDPLIVLLSLAEKELKSVELDLCSLTPGPDLNLHYGIAQQRRICLTDLIEFFKTLIEEITTGE